MTAIARSHHHVIAQPEGAVRVRVSELSTPHEARVECASGVEPAQVAADIAPSLQCGDLALAVRDETGELIVIARLSDGNTPRRKAIGCNDGTGAEVCREPDGAETLRVHDAGGRLLFEYRPAERRAVVSAPHGDLTFEAAEGSVRFAARDTIEAHAGHSLDLRGRRAVSIATEPMPGRAASHIALGKKGIDLVAERIGAHAATAEIAVDELQLVARMIRSAAESAHAVVGVLETQATRIVERARDVFRSASGLSQQTAARIKLQADETLEARARDTRIDADEDVKIQGETIRLG